MQAPSCKRLVNSIVNSVRSFTFPPPHLPLLPVSTWTSKVFFSFYFFLSFFSFLFFSLFLGSVFGPAGGVRFFSNSNYFVYFFSLCILSFFLFCFTFALLDFFFVFLFHLYSYFFLLFSFFLSLAISSLSSSSTSPPSLPLLPLPLLPPLSLCTLVSANVNVFSMS